MGKVSVIGYILGLIPRGDRVALRKQRQRFRQLDSEHIKYVVDSLRQTTTKINSIMAYHHKEGF